MPLREDIESVLVIGSGPIVIGQACEFDYSGTQACRVLRAEGIRVILVNSNPATIMTDPEFADATYVEPITPEFVEKVIEKERPDALLATLGGQTALNTAMALSAAGVLEKYGVELIGASIEAINRGENRQSFKQIVEELGGQVARSAICHSIDDCLAASGDLGYPMVVRPSFTMGGAGSGMAYDEAELRQIAGAGLAASPTTEVLLEESIIGWKEYELEVMRDRADNVVIVCSIENLDPMGVHTGDSITVAPAMTLTDREYQYLRDLSIGIIRSVGVDTGGCNIQYAVNPADGRVVVIEMNPRVSRSSALASKATGFPIAKIAAKVAVGYTLDEIRNDITTREDGQGGSAGTPASFEPALDYVVVKVPRFAFEKFPGADPRLTTHMKSVGEAMAIGRNFTEALQKALRSLESKDASFDFTPRSHKSTPTRHKSTSTRHESTPTRHESTDICDASAGICDASACICDASALLGEIGVPRDGRLRRVMDAIRAGATQAEIFEATKIDPWFVDQLFLISEIADQVAAAERLDAPTLRLAKRHGFADAQIGQLRGMREDVVRGVRQALGVRPVYKTVDTCAAEFAARTPYHYSSYDEECEVAAREREAVIILGSGPNRIGQGIEFDYSCVHASLALSYSKGGSGYDTIMVNCNPETVSTDYDTSDRLYFEPLTLEDVLEIVHREEQAGPVAGVICQLGGQTPLGLAQGLADAGVRIVGTQPASIHLAEERGAFGRVLADAGLPAPKHGLASSYEQARVIAGEIGYPVLVRPSYVLGGRGMEIVYDDDSLRGYIERATEISPDHPVLVDRFIDDAVEIDVDALYDGAELYLGGVMEHIEEAGIHSGDSACVLPPITLGAAEMARIREATAAIADGVGVRGLINIQFALGSDVLYVLEANPRASRTVPFVSKATAVPLAKAAARVMLGESIAELRAAGVLAASGDGGTPALGGLIEAPIAVKEAVMPFNRFKTRDGKTVDTVLGPEMRSTGEVMGIDASFGTAYAKSQAGAYGPLPLSGRVFVSMANRDKRTMIFPVKRLADLGFEVVATQGTAEVLWRNGIEATVVRKHFEGAGPNGEPTTISLIGQGAIDLIVNTPHGSAGGRAARIDGYEIRTAAVMAGVPCITTVQGLGAAVQGIEALRAGVVGVRSLQDWAAPGGPTPGSTAGSAAGSTGGARGEVAQGA
ncbi:MAG: carbamoyl-phosphate synthase large subunit [Nocardioides sp.]